MMRKTQFPPSLCILDPILQTAHFRPHPHLDPILWFQKLRHLHRITHARTRARHKHCSLFERSTLRAICDEGWNLEAQIIDSGILSQVAIDPRLQVQLTRVRNNVCGHELWTQRRIRVEALAKVPLRHCAGEERVALQFPRRDVVAGCVGANVGVCVRLRHVLCIA